MQVEWTAPHTLESKFGDLDLNATDPTTKRRYQILPSGYAVVPSLRVTQDNISQRDGSVLHPRFTGGMVATLTVRLQKNEQSDTEYTDACGADLTAMCDDLTRWTNGIRDLTYADNQRLIWTPTGAGDSRMLLDIELLAWLAPALADTETLATFAVESPFPYAVDLTQHSTSIPDSTPTTLLNDGSADTYPVIQVAGPFTSFTITNNSTGQEFNYDGTRTGASGVGGGSYAEIDTFRGTITEKPSLADLIPGVVPTTTDFFPISCDPAGVSITITGADSTWLWNRAWA